MMTRNGFTASGDSRCSFALSSLGDPRSPYTWSGTPRNLLDAFERQGYRVAAIDSSLSAPRRFIERAMHALSPLGPVDSLRAPRSRRASSGKATRAVEAAECDRVLHLGTLDLPAPPAPVLRRFLFIDTTWAIWRAQSVMLRKYSSRLLHVAEELEREVHAQIEHFFPIGEYVRQSLIDDYGVSPHRITTVGTGRGSIAPFDGEKDYSNGHILLVAKARFQDKGGDLLIEAFQRARQQVPTLRLTIVCATDSSLLRQSLPGVSCVSGISWEALQTLFNTASLYAMPALNEPWGLVYLEALACRTPLLGLNRNAFPELSGYGEYGFAAQEPDVDEIATLLVRALGDPDRLRRMGDEGQRHCLARYSWDAVAQRIASRICATE